MLVSVDVYRPAAREQLRVIAREVGQSIYEGAPGREASLSIWRAARGGRALTAAATCCWSTPPAACISTSSS